MKSIQLKFACRRGSTSRRSERGQSLVEIALSMLFLIWLISAIIDLGSALFSWIALRDAAQEGALYGSVNPIDTPGIRMRVVTASNRPIDLAQAFADGTLTITKTITGNACTEDLVALLEEMGVTTGVDLAAMMEAGVRAEEVLGQRLRSNVIRAGPVIHRESSPEKEPGLAPVPGP